VRVGGAQLKRGEGTSGAEVFKRLRKKGQPRRDV